MTTWLICVVSLLVYLAFLIVPCESQTITVNPSGTWTEGSSVTLTCSISSYSGVMNWKLGSTDVAKCTTQTCSGISTGEGAFLFGFDTTNHIFTWTIDPVKFSNNGNIIYCFDGTNTANYTATVQTIPVTSTPESPQDETAKGIAIAGLGFALLGFALIFSVPRWIVRKAQPNTNKQEAMDDEEMIKHLITEYLNEDKKMKKWQPTHGQILEHLEIKTEAEQEARVWKTYRKENKTEAGQEARENKTEAGQEARENKTEAGQEARKEESLMKLMPDKMMFEYSIEKYFTEKDEQMTEWLNKSTTINRLISECLKIKKNDGHNSVKEAEKARYKSLKEAEKAGYESLKEVEKAGDKSLNKEDMMKKFRSGETKALYPLIEKCWNKDETIKWLSDQKTIKRSITECLETLEKQRVEGELTSGGMKHGEKSLIVNLKTPKNEAD